MNFDFYLFGTPDGYDQYPLDDKEILFQSFYDKNCPVQLTLYRKAELVYFTYLRNLDVKGIHYFGMSIVLNGSYPDSISEVLEVFDLLFDGIVRRGRILARNSYGKVYFACSRLSESMEEVEVTTRECRNLVETRLERLEKALPEEYAVQSREAFFAFDSGFIPVNLDESLKYYDRIHFKKTESGKPAASESVSTSPKTRLPLLIVSLLLVAAAVLYYCFVYQGKPKETNLLVSEQNTLSGSQEPQAPTTEITILSSTVPQDTDVILAENTSAEVVELVAIEQPKDDNSGLNNENSEKATNPKQEEIQEIPIADKPKQESKPKEPPQQTNNKENKVDDSEIEEENGSVEEKAIIIWEVENKPYPDGKYSGTLRNHIREGFGKFEFDNGNRYEGEWKNGEMHGQGSLYYKNGERYVAIWKKGVMQNGYVEHYNKDGDIYKGNVLVIDGQVRYDGEGTMEYHSGSPKVSYVGHWKNGNRDGYGVLRFSNGSRYEGDFKNGKYDGEGTLYYQSGEKYVGGFKNGKYDGKGKEFFANGNLMAEGTYKDGKRVDSK